MGVIYSLYLNEKATEVLLSPFDGEIVCTKKYDLIRDKLAVRVGEIWVIPKAEKALLLQFELSEIS